MNEVKPTPCLHRWVVGAHCTKFNPRIEGHYFTCTKCNTQEFRLRETGVTLIRWPGPGRGERIEVA